MSNTKTRQELRGIFSTGNIPTEEEFADLFESSLNLEDDNYIFEELEANDAKNSEDIVTLAQRISAEETKSTGISTRVGTLETQNTTLFTRVGTLEDVVDFAMMDFKDPVTYASSINWPDTYNNGANGVGATLTAAGNGRLSVDGSYPVVNDRILIKNQTIQSQNGIYVVTNIGSGSTKWVITRATDYDTKVKIRPGNMISVQSGASNANTFWIQTATIDTVGTDMIAYTQFSTGFAIGTANQIAITGNTAPVVALADNIVLPGNAALTLVKGTTAQRPSVSTSSGMVRFNTTLGLLEYTNNANSWQNIATSADLSALRLNTISTAANFSTGNYVISTDVTTGFTDKNLVTKKYVNDYVSAGLSALRLNTISTAANFSTGNYVISTDVTTGFTDENLVTKKYVNDYVATVAVRPNFASCIYATGKDTIPLYTFGYLNSGGNAGLYSSGTSGIQTCSIIATYSIRTTAGEFQTTSSKNIKNIKAKGDSIFEKAINLFRSIVFSEYTYKDYLQRGTSTYYGIIAEDLAEVAPQYVTQVDDWRADIYQKSLAVTKLSNSHYTIVVKDSLKDIQSNKLKLIIQATEGESFIEVEILAHTDTSITILCERELPSELFVYGTWGSCPSVAKSEVGELSMVAVQGLFNTVENLTRQVAELTLSLENALSCIKALEEKVETYNGLKN